MKRNIILFISIVLPVNLFADGQAVKLSELPDDLIKYLAPFNDVGSWNSLQQSNKDLHRILKPRSVRLSMDLSEISTGLKNSMIAPQSKRTRRSRALYEVHFYHDSIEVRSLAAYVGNGYDWRSRLPGDYNFHRVSVSEDLKLPQLLGRLLMVVSPMPSPYDLYSENLPVSCASWIERIPHLVAIKIVGNEDPQAEEGLGCSILVRYE